MDLDGVPTSQLLETLNGRFSHVVILGVHDVLSEDGDEAEAFECLYKGSKTTAMGLVERGKIVLTEAIYVDMYGPMEVEEEGDEEPEEEGE